MLACTIGSCVYNSCGPPGYASHIHLLLVQQQPNMMLAFVLQVVAVYKDDGQRGHHMSDFIPKEELAKFMAACGDNKLAQQVRRIVVSLDVWRFA
jgi:hypothetical protein